MSTFHTRQAAKAKEALSHLSDARTEVEVAAKILGDYLVTSESDLHSEGPALRKTLAAVEAVEDAFRAVHESHERDLGLAAWRGEDAA